MKEFILNPLVQWVVVILYIGIIFGHIVVVDLWRKYKDRNKIKIDK
jgi:hypothetical protein